MFSLMRDRDISKAYEIQYCRGNFGACHRYQIKNKAQIPVGLLPDGTRYSTEDKHLDYPEDLRGTNITKTL